MPKVGLVETEKGLNKLKLALHISDLDTSEPFQELHNGRLRYTYGSTAPNGTQLTFSVLSPLVRRLSQKLDDLRWHQVSIVEDTIDPTLHQIHLDTLGTKGQTEGLGARHWAINGKFQGLQPRSPSDCLPGWRDSRPESSFSVASRPTPPFGSLLHSPNPLATKGVCRI